jgi:hypothetical protein
MQIRAAVFVLTPACLDEATSLVDAFAMTIDAFDDGEPSDLVEELRRGLVDLNRDTHAALERSADLHFSPTFSGIFLTRAALEALHTGLVVLRDWSREPEADPAVQASEGVVVQLLAGLEAIQ